jgi:hypothetical protein
MKNLKVSLYIALLLALPGIASAQSQIINNSTGSTLKSLIGNVISLINLIVPMLSAAAIAFFFYGLFRYVMNVGGSKGHRQGVEAIQFGLLAMLAIFMFWGLIRFIRSALLPGTGLTPAQEVQQGLAVPPQPFH